MFQDFAANENDPLGGVVHRARILVVEFGVTNVETPSWSVCVVDPWLPHRHVRISPPANSSSPQVPVGGASGLSTAVPTGAKPKPPLGPERTWSTCPPVAPAISAGSPVEFALRPITESAAESRSFALGTALSRKAGVGKACVMHR